jgi:hypothetical protein
MMRQQPNRKKKKTRRGHQEKERPPRQMSGAKDIPRVEGDEAPEGYRSSQPLSKPSHD